MDLKKSLEELKKNWEEFKQKKSLDELKKIWEDVKHLDFSSLDAQFQKQVAWFYQRYHPAKIMTFVGIVIIAAGIIGSGISLALLAHLSSKHTLWELVTKARFPFMVTILRCALFMWIFFTGFGIISRQRWAGISCMVAYILVQSQSVYVAEYFLISVAVSLAAFCACVVIQFHGEVLMLGLDEPFKMECSHENLKERSRGFSYWGYYTYCPGCEERVYFWDNIVSTPILLFFSLGWAVWWYWPLI
jgi:hypothetical protein